MNRVETTRQQLLLLIRAKPFEPFVLNLENGDRVAVEHPENIAIDSTANGLQDVYVISGKVRYWGKLAAITTAAILDKEPLPSEFANDPG